MRSDALHIRNNTLSQLPDSVSQPMTGIMTKGSQSIRANSFQPAKVLLRFDRTDADLLISDADIRREFPYEIGHGVVIEKWLSRKGVQGAAGSNPAVPIRKPPVLAGGFSSVGPPCDCQRRSLHSRNFVETR